MGPGAAGFSSEADRVIYMILVMLTVARRQTRIIGNVLASRQSAISSGTADCERADPREASQEGVAFIATVVVDLDASEGTIHKNIYGHFAEHLGRCIDDGLWVGETSGRPHVDGLRQDVVDALRDLQVPVLRWPGGCFADEYHWRDGIGRRDERPRRINGNWGQVIEDNQFGTHEFFRLCELLGCDAYVAGNVGTGTVRELRDWVEYITGPAEAELGSLRAQNGRSAPWDLRYVGVGNETWGCGGNMRPEYYADLYRHYQTFIRSANGRPAKIAAGSHDGNYGWTEVLMREAGPWMDGLSLHYYTVPGTWREKGSATDFGVSEWATTLKKALAIDDLIRGHSAIMDRYDPERRVAMVVDEWGTWYDPEPGTNPAFLYQQNTLRDALVAALTLNIFHAHCGRVRMANLAQTVNVLQAVILTDGPMMVRTPTYHVFKLFQVHQGNQHVAVHVVADPYRVGDLELPRVHASASRDGAGTLHVSLVNLDHEHATPVAIICYDRSGTVGWPVVCGQILTADRMNAANTFDAPDTVVPRALEGVDSAGGRIRVEVPAKAVVQLTMRREDADH